MKGCLNVPRLIIFDIKGQAGSWVSQVPSEPWDFGLIDSKWFQPFPTQAEGADGNGQESPDTRDGTLRLGRQLLNGGMLARTLQNLMDSKYPETFTSHKSAQRINWSCYVIKKNNWYWSGANP